MKICPGKLSVLVPGTWEIGPPRLAAPAIVIDPTPHHHQSTVPSEGKVEVSQVWELVVLHPLSIVSAAVGEIDWRSRRTYSY